MSSRYKIILVCVVLVVGTLAYKLFYIPPFDYVNWMKYPNERYKFVNSIIDSELLLGKEYKDVLSMLGEPDIIRNNSAIGEEHYTYNPNHSTLVYITREAKLIDIEQLRVQIQNNKVVDVSRYHD